jgi:hypothetical protein
MDLLGALDVPETEDDIQQLLDRGRLSERNAVDLKRELGSTEGGRKELARDLASLALEGGLILAGMARMP